MHTTVEFEQTTEAFWLTAIALSLIKQVNFVKTIIVSYQKLPFKKVSEWIYIAVIVASRECTLQDCVDGGFIPQTDITVEDVPHRECWKNPDIYIRYIRTSSL